jgi:hypothetical protein
MAAALDEEAVEAEEAEAAAAAAAAIMTTARPHQQRIRGQPYELTATTASTHILELATTASLHFPTKPLMNGE